MAELIITDDNYLEQLAPFIDGQRVRRGLIPRNFVTTPAGMYATSEPWSLQIPVIQRDEWSDRIADMERTKSRLSDIRNQGNDGQQIVSLDQNGQGFCWAYSTTSAVTLLRAVANLPYVRLSAHAVACKIYNFQDRGAWGALSLDFYAKSGCPDVEHWPEKSMQRQYDNVATWENAALHKVTEGWMDMDVAAYDRELSFDQVATCLLSRIPVVVDFNWYTHSVCGCDLVELDRSLELYDVNRWGIRIWNSWRDSWGTAGMGVLAGNKARPDGASVPRVTMG